jgi:hypothetical protein
MDVEKDFVTVDYDDPPFNASSRDKLTLRLFQTHAWYGASQTFSLQFWSGGRPV